MDEALLEKQREAYAVEGADDTQPVRPQKKRKNQYTNGEEVRSLVAPAAFLLTVELEQREWLFQEDKVRRSSGTKEYCGICHEPPLGCQNG